MAQTRSRIDLFETPVSLDASVLERSGLVAFVVATQDARVVGANDAMQVLLGVTDAAGLEGTKLTEFFCDFSTWSEWCVSGSDPSPVEVRLKTVGGTERWCRGEVWSQGDGGARRIVAMLVDATDRHALRAAAQRGARMEALGSLTAGVAHDFNNLLTVLVGNLYLLGEEVRERPRVYEKLKAARDAGKRGADLIKQLMSFARREEMAVGFIDPAKIVANIVPLLRRALGTRIKFETDLKEVGAVRASAAQLESVVVNLAVNARDAIEGKGEIAVATGALQVGEADAKAMRLARAGAYVAISVRDTGSGIPAEAIARVFEPFFSTKKDRGGTGLGLTMVKWFAEQAGGSVSVRSALGSGTTITVLLPRAREALPDGDDKTMPLSTLPAGTERVVVLALEDALRSMIHQTLELLGYRVRVVSSVEELLGTLAAERADLLVLDGLGLGDADVLIRARAVVSRLSIIATVEPTRRGELAHLKGVEPLVKPFTLADLAHSVRRSLDAGLRAS